MGLYHRITIKRTSLSKELIQSNISENYSHLVTFSGFLRMRGVVGVNGFDTPENVRKWEYFLKKDVLSIVTLWIISKNQNHFFRNIKIKLKFSWVYVGFPASGWTKTICMPLEIFPEIIGGFQEKNKQTDRQTSYCFGGRILLLRILRTHALIQDLCIVSNNTYEVKQDLK